MASIQIREVNGSGPYAYKVTYKGNNEHHWEYLGKMSNLCTQDLEDAKNNNTTPKTGFSINTDDINDPALQQLTNDIDEDELGDLLEALGDEGGLAFDADKGMPALLKYLDTDDSELKDAIRTIQHDTRRAGLSRSRTVEYLPADADEIEAALDVIERKIGVRPAELDDSGDSLKLSNTEIKPGNEEITTQLINDVMESVQTHRNAAEIDKQESVQEAVEGALGAGVVREAKKNASDPDALGFADPDDIPASGEGLTLTDLYGVGPATANSVHERGEDISLADFGEMSKMQRGRVAVDVDVKENPDHVQDTVSELYAETGDIKTALVGAMQMTAKGDFSAVDTSNVMSVQDNGLDPDHPVIDGEFDEHGPSDVTAAGVHGQDNAEVVGVGGGKYSKKYWELVATGRDDITRMRKGDNRDKIGDDGTQSRPLVVDFEDGSSVVIAPRID